MKKIIFFMLPLLLYIAMAAVDVKAVEESSEIEPEDDLGEQTYSLDFFMASTDTYKPAGYLCRKSSGSITVDGARLCGYREVVNDKAYCYYIYTYNSSTYTAGINS